MWCQSWEKGGLLRVKAGAEGSGISPELLRKLNVNRRRQLYSKCGPRWREKYVELVWGESRVRLSPRLQPLRAEEEEGRLKVRVRESKRMLVVFGLRRTKEWGNSQLTHLAQRFFIMGIKGIIGQHDPRDSGRTPTPAARNPRLSPPPHLSTFPKIRK